jgi:hypothetical protein
MSFDLSTLRGEHFLDKKGDEFLIEGVNGSLPLTLVDVAIAAKPVVSSAIRPPFSLLFRCTIPVNIREHEIFNLRHATIGLMEGVFIGPVTIPDPKWGEGMYWEAIFG